MTKPRAKSAKKAERSSADGVKGCFLRVGFGKKEEVVFRIYTKDCSSFKDYRLAAHDIFVTIDKGSGLEFVEDERGKRLDYSLERLGRATPKGKKS